MEKRRVDDGGGNTVACFACLSSFHLCTRLVFFPALQAKDEKTRRFSSLQWKNRCTFCHVIFALAFYLIQVVPQTVGAFTIRGKKEKNAQTFSVDF